MNNKQKGQIVFPELSWKKMVQFIKVWDSRKTFTQVFMGILT